jgi:hypothetical protein
VDSKASDKLRIQFQRLGTIVWKDDNDTVRKPDARGFALSWLSDSSPLPVRLVTRRNTNKERPTMHRQRASKRETNYKGASRKRSRRTRKKKSTQRRRRR